MVVIVFESIGMQLHISRGWIIGPRFKSEAESGALRFVHDWYEVVEYEGWMIERYLKSKAASLRSYKFE